MLGRCCSGWLTKNLMLVISGFRLVIMGNGKKTIPFPGFQRGPISTTVQQTLLASTTVQPLASFMCWWREPITHGGWVKKSIFNKVPQPIQGQSLKVCKPMSQAISSHLIETYQPTVGQLERSGLKAYENHVPGHLLESLEYIAPPTRDARNVRRPSAVNIPVDVIKSTNIEALSRRYKCRVS